jgi:hypothetical protein
MKRQWINLRDSGLVFGAGLSALAGALVLLWLLQRASGTSVRERLSQVTPLESWLLWTAAFTWVGYVLFYSSMSGIQAWYSANLLMPAFVLLFAVWSSLDGATTRASAVFRLAFPLVVGAVLLLTIRSTYPLADRPGRWPHQRAMLQAGLYLRDHPLPARVAGWNVGIVGYYADRPVINLDGVVNNDVYRYAVSNRLPLYMRERSIGYLVDFHEMFEGSAPRRGGYDDPGFLSRLRSLAVFDEGQYPGWTHLTLYQIVDVVAHSREARRPPLPVANDALVSARALRGVRGHDLP